MGDFNKFCGAKVLITGHTGFKGSWLTAWMLMLGAKVTGYSDCIPTKPSAFEAMDLENKITHIIADVRDLEKLSDVISKEKPDFIFHLAAQPIVSLSYTNPIETIDINVRGTANILQAILDSGHKCTSIMVASDKCYFNNEWTWGYRENDPLGGKDIYSASKAASEIITASYYQSFFKGQAIQRMASVRAGNVIGGGDWSIDRLVADAARAWSSDEKLIIRSPKAVRPWQHVVDCLNGYITLALALHEDETLNGEAFNFGPSGESTMTVQELLTELATTWGDDVVSSIQFQANTMPEANLLRLSVDKANTALNWYPRQHIDLTLKLTSEWYKAFYSHSIDMGKLTQKQILLLNSST